MRMFTRLSAVGLCLGAMATGAAVVYAGGSADMEAHGCKDVRVQTALAQNIRAKEATCRGARRLVTVFSEWMIDNGVSPTHSAGYHFGRYTCTAKKAAAKRWRARCVDDEASVSFSWRRVK